MQTSITSLELKEIHEVLAQFGLHDKDQAVYLAILQQQETTLTPLAKAARLPITTVQSIVERLKERGLLQVTMHKSRHLYQAHEPRILLELLQRQSQEVTSIMPLLDKLRSDTVREAKIKIYYRERMQDIFYEALKTKNKYIYEIIAAKELQEILGEKLHFTKQRVQKNIRLKSLRVETREIKTYSKSKHVQEFREARFLPRELTFTSSIMFWDNTIAFFTTKNEGIAWTIESKTIIETYKQLFGLLWNISRPMITAEGHV